jgi:glycosyltransferase involved in cell wall biosynthesis
VQEQTYSHWEAIVVDDGSVDDTANAVTALSREDGRIRYIQQKKNRGAQAARNVGIRAARGEWIGFLDSDDLFLPNSLEIRMETLIRERVSVVHSQCNWIREDGSVESYGIPPLAGNVYTRLLRGPAPLLQCLLVAKEALAKIGYLDENIVAFQEWETVIRLAKHYPFGFVAAPTFLYDVRPDSMSKNDLLGAKGYEQVFQKHFFPILFLTGPSSLASHYQTASTWYERGGDEAAARRCSGVAKVWSFLGKPQSALRKLDRGIQELVGRH